MTILCYGEIDLDIYLAVNQFPGVDTYSSVQDQFTNVGGGAGNTAVWLANWGLPVRLIGNELGNDANGVEVKQALSNHQYLDTQYLVYKENQASLVCQCLVRPDGERTFIMHTPKDMQVTKLLPEMLTDVSWLSLDMSGRLQPRLEAAQLARSHNTSILINDVYTIDHPIAALATIIVISAAVVRAKLPTTSPFSIAQAIREKHRCSVIVTDGANPVHAYLSSGDNCTYMPPQVNVVDTTGSGDVFKAGLLYGLSQDLALQQAIKWAMAAGTSNAQVAGTTLNPNPLNIVKKLASII
jgi:sugar/nucleoside kinase (ribokinase family)